MSNNDGEEREREQERRAKNRSWKWNMILMPSPQIIVQMSCDDSFLQKMTCYLVLVTADIDFSYFLLCWYPFILNYNFSFWGRCVVDWAFSFHCWMTMRQIAEFGGLSHQLHLWNNTADLLLLLVSQHSGIVILLCASVEQWRELNLFGPQLMQQVTASAVMHQMELWHHLIHNGNWWIMLNKHRNMLEWYFKNVGSGILLSEVPYKRPLFDPFPDTNLVKIL